MRIREFLGYISPAYARINKALRKQGHIRILMYHDINETQRGKFEEQIRYLKKKGYQFTDYKTLKGILAGEIMIKETYILLTFDDGFQSNYQISKILDKYKIKGIFFITTSFIEMMDRTQEDTFIEHSFLVNSTEIFEEKTGSKALSWNQIRQMERQGHTIGAHTQTHIRLSETDTKQIMQEMFKSKKVLEEQLGSVVELMAYPFGDIRSIDKLSLSIAEKYFKYIFSGVRGRNNQMTDRRGIYRDQINPFDDKRYLRFIVEGGLDLLYRRKRKMLFSMISDKKMSQN